MAGEAVYARGIDDARLRVKVRNALGQFQSMNQAVKGVNQRSIEWLADRAGDELASRVEQNNRKPSIGEDGQRPGQLEAAVRDVTHSHASQDGFDFLIHQRMDDAAVYWRAIELGSRIWVDKRIRAAWFDGTEFVGPNTSGRGRDWFVKLKKGTRADFTGMIIHRPVPAYHYAQVARDEFIATDKYGDFIEQATKSYQERIGLEVKGKRSRR